MIDILVVEDNDELRDVLERFLLHEGYQTRCVQRGDDVTAGEGASSSR